MRAGVIGRMAVVAALTAVAACRVMTPPPDAMPTSTPAAEPTVAAVPIPATPAFPPPPPNMFDFPPDGSVSPEAAATMVAAGWEGRLVAVAAGASGVHNEVSVLDLGTGKIDTIWSTAEGANVSDWAPDPLGGRIAYRSIQRQGTAVEALESIVIQGLTAGAAPIEVATTDTKRARIAGFVWAASGGAIVYSRVSGRLADVADAAPQAAETFEIHRVVVPIDGVPASAVDDQVIYQSEIEAESLVDLALVAHDAESGRAVIAVTARDSGLVSALDVVTLSTGEARRIDIEPTRPMTVPSPDGRWLALVTAGPDAWQLRVLSLAEDSDGLASPLGWVDGDRTVQLPIWSPDSRRLAWTETEGNMFDHPGPTTLHTIFIDATDGAITMEIEGAVRPISFAPDGTAILVGSAEPTELTPDWSGLAVLALPNGERRILPWQPSADTWWLGWVR